MSALLLLPLGFSPALRPLPAAPACGLRSAAVPLARRGVAVAMDASDIDSLLEDVEVEADAEEVAAPAAAPPAEPSDPLGGLAEGSWEMTAEGGVERLRVAVAGKLLTFESGKLARLASGAVTAVTGDTHVFCAATIDRRTPPRPIDFTPLRVDYCERKSAAGRTNGGYIKRDGRPSDHETLVARIIDRPIRPLISAGWCLETQLAAYVLAYDGVHPPDALAVCAASAALALSEAPFPRPVAGVRVAQVDGALVVNPSPEQLRGATLDLVVAGTKEAVMMVEGSGDFVPEETLVEALEVGLGAIATIASAIEDWAERIGQPTHAPGFLPPAAGVAPYLDAFEVDGEALPNAYRKAMVGGTKEQRERACVDLQARVVEEVVGAQRREAAAAEAAAARDDEEAEEEGEEGEGPSTAGKGEDEVLLASASFEEAEIRGALKKMACEAMREIVAATGERTDGRSTTQVRPISVEMAPLPPVVHGSVLFTRGETQALGTTTLGDSSMAQRYEDLEGEKRKRFYLQYAFPPFSVGEVGRVGSPGRREVGHGNLAERALRAALPGEDEFPYVIRTESLITESCGSSSMASVCAGALSMRAAGVPLKSLVAGVAMGLLLDESGEGGEPIILTDILGSEDALGTMDFKVAGNEVGISAFQLDIKCEGLSIELMRRALRQAREGRLHILSEMRKACGDSEVRLPPGVGRIRSFAVPSKVVGKIIGPGGATINGLISDTGVDNISIDKSDPAVVTITSTSDEAIALAEAQVRELVGESGAATERAPRPSGPPPPPPPPIRVDDIYEACEIKNMVPFGVFVALRPGVDGFCHISELSEQYIKSIDQVGLKRGDAVDVRVTEVNKDGKYRVAVLTDFEIAPPPAGR